MNDEVLFTKEDIQLAVRLHRATNVAEVIQIVGKLEFSTKLYPWMQNGPQETWVGRLVNHSSLRAFLRALPEEVLMECVL